MREILFRGFEGKKGNGRWVEGLLLSYEGKPVIVTKVTTPRNIPFAMNLEFKRVKPETVGQYTGLTDINGKRIFEGDICLCDRNINDHIDKKTYIVKHDPLRGWCGESKDGWGEFDGSSWECAEVIGNVHDNPELLGGAE